MFAMIKNVAKKSQIKRKSDGLDLDNISDLSTLLAQSEGTAVSSGSLMLEMSLIDEDPNQPRTEDNPGFTIESLNELAATIQLRGVKSPISVRDNPAVPGRYIINHGARRFRASKLADKTHIPGFIDNDYQDADQVIENLQRNELTPREVADYIGRELAKNKKKGEIAKEIGKSRAFITQHITLLDLPEPIADVFNSDRVRDVTVINELVTAYKKHPKEVSNWLLDESQEITRGSVKWLREFLDDKSRTLTPVDELTEEPETKSKAHDQDNGQYDVQNDQNANKNKKEETNKETLKLEKPIVQVQHCNRLAQLILHRRPSKIGLAWFKYEDNGEEFETVIADAKLVAIVEG